MGEKGGSQLKTRKWKERGGGTHPALEVGTSPNSTPSRLPFPQAPIPYLLLFGTWGMPGTPGRGKTFG